MQALFQISKLCAGEGSIPAYWVGSTAPLDVDGTAPEPGPGEAPPRPPGVAGVPSTGQSGAGTPVSLEQMGQEAGIRDIARTLDDNPESELVVFVHGFNNPTVVAANRFGAAYRFVSSDPAILARKGVVCVGYHWPSEHMGRPRGSTFRAMPAALLPLLALGTLSLLVSTATWFLVRPSPVAFLLLSLLVYIPGFFLLSLPLAEFLMRLVVYFRDGYRAIQYGVPDLVEVLRQLDLALQVQRTPPAGAPGVPPAIRRIRLSMIGHSMGALVVTSTVRILSDVFAPGSIILPSKADPEAPLSPDIGNVFSLGRLVLVSPDIPAETLMLGRANFLGSCLLRFEEAYLFSNEGDVVLGMISTMANYFSFPTQRSAHGQRLGNVGVLSSEYGIASDGGTKSGPPDLRSFLSGLRLGDLTLAQLNERLLPAIRKTGAGGTAPETELPSRFSYFDCTDYAEDGRGMVTLALHKPRLTEWDRWKLLLGYTGVPGLRRVDVHSGYFDGTFCQRTIFRLACLGMAGLLNSLDPDGAQGLARLHDECRDHGVKVKLREEGFAPAGKPPHRAVPATAERNHLPPGEGSLGG